MAKGRSKETSSSFINITQLPDDAFRCLLCEGIIGDKDKYERHLLAEHMVINNRSWLIDQTLARVRRPGFENSKEIVNKDVEVTEAQFPTNEKSANNSSEKVPQDILCGSEEVNSGEHSHETLTRWVNSAMKKSRVDIKNCLYAFNAMKKSRVDIINCHYTLNGEENNNLYRKRRSEAEDNKSSCWEETSPSSDTQGKELVGLNNGARNSNKNEEYISSIQSSPPVTPVVSVSTNSRASSPHSVPSTSATTASSLSNPDPVDEFAYQCPFPQCSFYTDYSGMKTGSAARHGISEHNISPTDFKTRGLKWRRVSRMKLWRRGVGAVA